MPFSVITPTPYLPERKKSYRNFNSQHIYQQSITSRMVGHKQHLYITGTNTAGRKEYRYTCQSTLSRLPSRTRAVKPYHTEWIKRCDTSYVRRRKEWGGKGGERKKKNTDWLDCSEHVRVRNRCPNSRWSSTFPMFLTSPSNTGP